MMVNRGVFKSRIYGVVYLLLGITAIVFLCVGVCGCITYLLLDILSRQDPAPLAIIIYGALAVTGLIIHIIVRVGNGYGILKYYLPKWYKHE